MRIQSSILTPRDSGGCIESFRLASKDRIAVNGLLRLQESRKSLTKEMFFRKKIIVVGCPANLDTDFVINIMRQWTNSIEINVIGKRKPTIWKNSAPHIV